jgi:hypothetical protein
MGRSLDAYLAALVAHDPAAAPLALDVRSTENGVETARGSGLWRTASRLGALQRRYIDPVSGQAAYYGTIEEGAGTALVSIRIRFRGRSIAETEAIVARKGDMLFDAAGAAASPPRAEAIARGGVRPSSRVAMIAAVNAYFDALQGGDPARVPKVDGCERLENGTKVTDRALSAAALQDEARSDCTTGLNSLPISKVAYRRMPVADTSAGVVLGIGLFQRPPGAKWPDGSPRKRNLIHEYFATDGGRIVQIFAVMRYLEPEESDSTGW